MFEKNRIAREQECLRGQNPGEPLVNEVVLVVQSVADAFKSFVIGVHLFKIGTSPTPKNSPRLCPAYFA